MLVSASSLQHEHAICVQAVWFQQALTRISYCHRSHGSMTWPSVTRAGRWSCPLVAFVRFATAKRHVEKAQTFEKFVKRTLITSSVFNLFFSATWDDFWQRCDTARTKTQSIMSGKKHRDRDRLSEIDWFAADTQVHRLPREPRGRRNYLWLPEIWINAHRPLAQWRNGPSSWTARFRIAFVLTPNIVEKAIYWNVFIFFTVNYLSCNTSMI